MSPSRRDAVGSILRERIHSALEAGVIAPGDRLPSVRAVGAELHADPRVVLSAYTQLSAEGLVELRPRSGIFVASTQRARRERVPAASWITEVLAEGVARGIPLAQTARWIQRAARTRGLRIGVTAGTRDQRAGLCRELEVGYGVAATAIAPETLSGALPALRRMHLLVTTRATEAAAGRAAARAGIAVATVALRGDLLSVEWELVLRHPVYVVVDDPLFGRMVRELVKGSPNPTDVRILVVGRDDVSQIPPDALTYVTASAERRLGRVRIPGQRLPPTRLLDRDSVRRIVSALLAHTLPNGR